MRLPRIVDVSLRANLCRFCLLTNIAGTGRSAPAFDEATERVWAPRTVVGTHSHPFDADAVITHGEMWLSCGGSTQHLRPGWHLCARQRHAAFRALRTRGRHRLGCAPNTTL